MIELNFAMLFDGRRDAIGLDRGGVERPYQVTLADYAAHLNGERAIGIFPMRDDATVWFGAIDLDEPNFELARTMQKLIPGTSWLERSRSGNAHVWVFFDSPAPAWAVRAVLRNATEGVGRRDVEVFPKQDGLKPGMVGNYINLPLFGEQRPFLAPVSTEGEHRALVLERIIETRQDPEPWVRRARTLGATPPAEREQTAAWGTQARVHPCAAYIIENRETNPIVPGARHQVLFHLAKMLLNWRECSPEEARRWVDAVNEAGTQPLGERELDRQFENALNGEWTSTGCDDPIMAPYVRPDCPIANGR